MTRAVCKFGINHKSNHKLLKHRRIGFFRGLYKNYTQINYGYIVLLGDPEQIDAPRLSKRTCGLVVAAEKLKGQKCVSIITMEKDECQRSELARIAEELL